MAGELDIDLDQVRAFLRSKADRRQAALDERFAKATADAQDIVAEIAATLNPRKIYQWGSLLDRRRFTEISDIDIALEGLDGPEAFFGALGIALQRARLPVDVVELEKLPRGTAERIRRKGKLVYERADP